MKKTYILIKEPKCGFIYQTLFMTRKYLFPKTMNCEDNFWGLDTIRSSPELTSARHCNHIATRLSAAAPRKRASRTLPIRRQDGRRPRRRRLGLSSPDVSAGAKPLRRSQRQGVSNTSPSSHAIVKTRLNLTQTGRSELLLDGAAAGICAD